MARNSEGFWYVVSLKYSPGHTALFRAFSSQAQRHSKTIQIISNEYRWMLQDDLTETEFFGHSKDNMGIVLDCIIFVLFRWMLIVHLFRRRPPKLIYFVNPHPLNIPVSVLAKIINSNCHILVHLHEPHAYRNKSFGWRRRLKEAVIAKVQAIGIGISDQVVVSSLAAKAAYQNSNLPSRATEVVPLMYEDFSSHDASVKRDHVTFVGAATESRGIKRFLQLAEYANEKHDTSIHFHIITRDPIERYLKDVNTPTRSRLRITNKLNISNEEIAAALGSSFACAILYQYPIMQSGVVPVALMSGTPIICPNIGGLAEMLINGESCEFVSVEATPKELYEAVKCVQRNQEEMTRASRLTFERVYHESNWGRYFSWLTQI